MQRWTLENTVSKSGPWNNVQISQHSDYSYSCTRSAKEVKTQHIEKPNTNSLLCKLWRKWEINPTHLLWPSQWLLCESIFGNNKLGCWDQQSRKLKNMKVLLLTVPDKKLTGSIKSWGNCVNEKVSKANKSITVSTGKLWGNRFP